MNEHSKIHVDRWKDCLPAYVGMVCGLLKSVSRASFSENKWESCPAIYLVWTLRGAGLDMIYNTFLFRGYQESCRAIYFVWTLRGAWMDMIYNPFV
ncbi:hypothetical protein CEXT_703871 [Caerostris extrusa]|uniref:Uncharacterized protein n=1 Tax=Caerostris extrusa TaxID=172846 RepID=A0AAV4VHK4_CAEEX|nr:hypothetical protein CEXT_703871 [Caerostris extrusa]